MKNIVLKLLTMFLFIGLPQISCSDSTSNPKPVCTYEDIELNTSNLGMLKQTDIIGEWILRSFINLTNCNIENEPEEFPRHAVIISFDDSNQVSGHTSNEFYGYYALTNNEIRLDIRSETEINEPKWAIKFLKATNNMDYASIKNSKLFVFFNESSEVMVFKKN